MFLSYMDYFKVAILVFFIVSILILIFKKDEVSYSELLERYSDIYQELDTYVKPGYASLLKGLFYIGVLVFMIGVITMVMQSI